MPEREQEDNFDGSILGDRYQLGPLLARGSQGATYRGIDRQTQQPVAVKVFALGKASEWKSFDLFRRECEVLRDLSHPRIPKFLDELSSPDGGTYYLVMEYVAGVTLRDRLRDRGALGEAELWQALWQVVDVLSYLHGRSPCVVHRDIKPSNLIERPGGDIALVDFGGVRNLVRADGGSTLVGTFGYMAPEQLHGEATPQTDLYSLGATLVALGTGVEPEHLPRDGLRIDFAAQLRVSPSLDLLLRRLTEPVPERRPRSGPALREELEQISQGAPAPAEEGGVPVEIPPLPADMPPQLGIVAGVLMAIIGTVGTVVVGMLEVVLIPMVFTIISIFTSPDQRRRLDGQRGKVQAALRGANPALQQLSKRGISEFEGHRARLPNREREERLRGRRNRSGRLGGRRGGRGRG